MLVEEKNIVSVIVLLCGTRYKNEKNGRIVSWKRRLKLEFPFQLFYTCATTMVVADDLDSHGKKRTVRFFDSRLT